MKKFKIGDKVRFKKEILDKSNLLKDKTEDYKLLENWYQEEKIYSNFEHGMAYKAKKNIILEH